MKLNSEQLQAVKHNKGPLLIIAGAGTGKTTVVTERIKYLILSKKVSPSEILALTFTEKAAREMETRVDTVMPYGYTQMWISTFHSFCDRILRQEGLNIGLDTRYKLMTQGESIQFVRDNLFDFDLKYFKPLGNPTKFVGGMLQHFSRLQDEDVTPRDYITWASKFRGERDEKGKWKELANAYRKYDELKVNKSYLDFGDLIVKTLMLFRQRKNVLKEYQEQFKHVLVDEFQDTNYAQNELAIMLAGKEKNITVTGDDDQSIYRFRGAAVSNIIQFKKHFPKTKVVTLIKNYRSAQEILDKSYALIKHNNPDRLEAVENIDKELLSQVNIKNSEIGFFHLDRVENEADRVVRTTKRLVNESGYEYKDIAILVRANNHFEPFARAMTRLGVPYQFLGPGKLFRQPEIVDLVSYLKVLYNFEDSISLYRVLSHEHFEINSRDLAKLIIYARKSNVSLYEACEEVDGQKVSSDSKKKIGKFIKMINKHLKLVRKETAGQLLYYFLEDTDLLLKLLNPQSEKAELTAINVSKFFDKLKTYETEREDAGVVAVVDWLELSSELGESPLAADMDWNDVNAVNILTVHSAKGLEFPVIFLVNLVSQRFPTMHRREQIPIPDKLIKEVLPLGDYHLQEERRLFYVGMTRAMEKLFLTAANYYGEGKREKKLSPFIFEALGDSVVASEEKEGKQLSLVDFAQQDETKSKREKKKLHLDYLSYSQIQTFQICPLHYKLAYILKIPTPPSAPLSFGTTMHKVMNDIYRTPQKRKPRKDTLYKYLENNWVSHGYKDKKHEKEMYEQGKRYLAGYVDTQYDSKVAPHLLEKPFVVPIKGSNNEQMKIGGKIDRVDLLADKTVEIIDYKTSERIPSQKEVDRDKQLTFYALAATTINEDIFPISPENLKLSLYFFKENVKISTQRTKEDLKRTVDEIFTVKKQIEESDFDCSKHILCNSCEFKTFCLENV